MNQIIHEMFVEGENKPLTYDRTVDTLLISRARKLDLPIYFLESYSGATLEVGVDLVQIRAQMSRRPDGQKLVKLHHGMKVVIEQNEKRSYHNLEKMGVQKPRIPRVFVRPKGYKGKKENRNAKVHG